MHQHFQVINIFPVSTLILEPVDVSGARAHGREVQHNASPAGGGGTAVHYTSNPYFFLCRHLIHQHIQVINICPAAKALLEPVDVSGARERRAPRGVQHNASPALGRLAAVHYASNPYFFLCRHLTTESTGPVAMHTQA